MNQHQADDGSRAQRKLLIVDDEVKICRMLAEHFSIQEYDVRIAHSGEDALAMARLFSPHVVLLDLLMPGMSGIDTLKELKHLTPPPKILLISAADHTDVVTGALRLGADFYVCKPIKFIELDPLVHDCCASLGLDR